MIADHFGEAWDSSDCNGMCDVCQRNASGADNNDLKALDVSHEYLGPCTDILARARTADNRLTALKVVNCLSGKGEAALRPPGYDHRGRSRLQVELALAAMLLEGHVKEEFSFTPYKTNSYIVEGPRKGSSSS